MARTVATMNPERVRLRRAALRDWRALVELLTDPDVRLFLGGPRPRIVAHLMVAAGLMKDRLRPGPFDFVVTNYDDTVLGTVSVTRRRASRPGHVRPDGGELELSYVFRRTAWGRGAATSAARLVLERVARTGQPGEPVVVVTQERNEASRRLARRLGFVEVATFQEFGAAQVLAAAPLALISASPSTPRDARRTAEQ